MLTNKGLVEHVKMALNEQWGYVWGTFGDVLTENLLQEKLKQYPDGVGKYEDFIRHNWLNKRTVDCIGLIKSYLWWTESGPEYNPATDFCADNAFYDAKEKGRFDEFPKTDMPGLCLWKDGHIGVYIGNGKVIESHGTEYGVIQTPLTGEGSTAWTNWLKYPNIKYEEEIVMEDKTYIEIIQEVSDGNVTQWLKGIALAEAMAKDDSNLGDLEIFRFLPLLIEKIYRKYNV